MNCFYGNCFGNNINVDHHGSNHDSQNWRLQQPLLCLQWVPISDEEGCENFGCSAAAEEECSVGSQREDLWILSNYLDQDVHTMCNEGAQWPREIWIIITKINLQNIVKHFQDIATKVLGNLSIYGGFFQYKFCQEYCAGDLGQISQILSYFFIILPPHNDHNINQLNCLTLQQGKAQLTARFV